MGQPEPGVGRPAVQCAADRAGLVALDGSRAAGCRRGRPLSLPA